MRRLAPVVLVVLGCGDNLAGPDPDPSGERYQDPLVRVADLAGGGVLGIEELALSSDHLFACTANGLISWDRRDPSSLVEVSRDDVAGEGSCQHLATTEENVFVVHRDAPGSPAVLVAYELTNGGPALVDSYSDGLPMEGVAASAGSVVVASRESGVLALEWTPGGFGSTSRVAGFTNAWAAARVSDSLFALADAGEGISLVAITSGNVAAEMARLPLAGSPQTVAVAGDVLFVGAGVSGIFAVDISNPASPSLLGATETPGSVRQLAVTGDVLFVADWNDARVYDRTNPASLLALATERVVRPTLSGVTAIAAEADDVFVGDWQAPVVLKHFATRHAPDLSTRQLSVDFGKISPGDDDAAIVLVRNDGDRPLVVDNVVVTGRSFTANTTSTTLSPGERFALEIQFSPGSNDEARGAVSLLSDDPDQPAFTIDLVGNGRELAVGDPLPEVAVAFLGGGEWRSSQALGSVHLLAYFATF